MAPSPLLRLALLPLSARLGAPLVVQTPFGQAPLLGWDGRDDDISAARSQPSSANATAGSSWVDSVPKLQIYGTFDSGTNLLGALLEANLGALMKRVCPNWHSRCFFPKHSLPCALPEHVRSLSGDGGRVVVVAMVRSPVSQINSWGKAPYLLDKCLPGDWADYHEETCSLSWNNASESFSGLAGFWNDHARAYHEMKQFASDRTEVLVVEYERLVIETELVLEEVSAALSVVLDRDNIDLIQDPAKTHGKPHGRAEAFQDIVEGRYLQEKPMSNKSTRAYVCEHLDRELLALHRIPGGTTSRSYLADCQAIDVT